VYDQYLNFIVSEPDLFSLGMGNETYWAMNTAKIADEVMDAAVDRIVTGLFSVVVTMGKQDCIQYQLLGLFQVTQVLFQLYDARNKVPQKL